MRIQEWIARLRAETDYEIRGVADFLTAAEEHRRDTVYLMYASDRAQPSDVIGPVRQSCNTVVDAALAVTNKRSRRGQEAVDEVELVRDRVRAALVGWEPPTSAGPIQYQRGRLVRFDRERGVIWWVDSFELPDFMVAAS